MRYMPSMPRHGRIETGALARAPQTARPAPGRRRLEPIGPEKLRRLRESILNGSYPLDAAVIGGLAKMFLGPDGPPSPEKK